MAARGAGKQPWAGEKGEWVWGSPGPGGAGGFGSLVPADTVGASLFGPPLGHTAHPGGACRLPV